MRTVATDGEYADGPARVLLPLLGIYALGTVSLQGFNLVYLRVAQDIGAGDASGLITAIPGIILGVACFLYGTLGDFIPLRRIVDVGIALIVAGSLLGFAFSSSLLGVIVARALQTLGYQAAASAYMILATAIRDPKKRGLYVGLMCAAFQGGTAIGMLSGGMLADINWALLLLIPLAGLACLPIMGRRVPARARAGRVDVVGLAIFSSLALLLTLAAANPRWWLIAGLVLGGVLFWRYIGRARAPFITRSFFTNVPWARSISLILIVYCMNFTVAPLMNGIGAAYYGLTPAQVSVRLLPAYCVALTTAMTSGAVMSRIGRGRTVRACIGFILTGTALLALCMSMGTWVITAAMCLIYAGFGALFTPIYDTVFATVAPRTEWARRRHERPRHAGQRRDRHRRVHAVARLGRIPGCRPRLRRRRSDRHRGRLAARIPVPPRALSYFLTRGAYARGARVVAFLGVRLLVASSLSCRWEVGVEPVGDASGLVDQLFGITVGSI